MGSIIKQVAISESSLNPLMKGYIPHAFKASIICIDKANINLESIQLLINTGIYREDSICEPSIASLIHSKLQNKLAKRDSSKLSDFFSFDLTNGGVGTIQAIQVVDNYIESGSISCGMVVAGDSEPIYGQSENYNYSDGASSLILMSNNIKGSGFISFKTYYDFNNKSDYVAYSKFHNDKLSLRIEEKESYVRNMVQLSINSIDSFLNNMNIQLGDIDLIISSQSPVSFIETLQNKMNFTNNIIHDGQKVKHSAGILFSLDNAFKTNDFQSSKNILFLSVGAGLAVSLALYINS